MSGILHIVYYLSTIIAIGCISFSIIHIIYMLQKELTREMRAQILSFMPAFFMLITLVPALISILLCTKINPEPIDRMVSKGLEFYMVYIGPITTAVCAAGAMFLDSRGRRANIGTIIAAAAYLIIMQIILKG